MELGWGRYRLHRADEWLDIIGISYRPGNQWFYQGETIALDDRHYRPFAAILQKVWQRYQRPLLIAETGAEEDPRVPWACYIFEQAVQVMQGPRRGGGDLPLSYRRLPQLE